jgi:arylsulfatase
VKASLPGVARSSRTSSLEHGALLVDGKQVAQRRIDRTVMIRFSLDETFDVGQDTGTPVVEDYVDQMPFKFSGTLEKFTIELK